jgi:UDP-N-acetylmuramoyl-L-alanyl-D-glutamate--2,6-diaminopimelate ligase
VVVERECPAAGPNQVVVDNVAAAHARTVHALAGDPADSMLVVGCTGSQGSGAVGFFLRSILDAAHRRHAIIGRRSWTDGSATRPLPAAHPQPESLATMLAAMKRQTVETAIVQFTPEDLAATSIASGFRLATAVVTQVADDPDEPRDLTVERRRAAARLVRAVMPGGCVVLNADDPDCLILAGSNLEARVLTIGVDQPADLTAEVDRLDPAGCRLRVRGLGEERAVDLHLLGVDRIRQALAAAAVAWDAGIEPEAIVEGLESVTHLPGRFEAIDEGQPFDVRIDQGSTSLEVAHALNVLRSLHPGGRILCVLGAEGHRPREERRTLAAAAELRCNQLVFTSDNPRGEDPNAILDDLLSGCRCPGQAIVEPDRRAAIETALALAGPGDAVLIAGKGREAFQILSDRVVPFDDRRIAARYLRERFAQLRRHSA